MPAAQPTIPQTLAAWFRNETSQRGFPAALATLFSKLWEFLLDSTPARRRSRYGDADFDWEHHVNTTGATVRQRDRFLGLFHSPYQPTEPALFHEMMTHFAGEDLSTFTFIDIGSGKGRALLMAADYPFRGILGVELFPELHLAAEENIRQYSSPTQRCHAIRSIQADAREFRFPSGPLLLYLFNPLPDAGLAQFLQNLQQSLAANPAEVILLYHNPLLEPLLAAVPQLHKTAATHQYSIFRN